MCIRDRRHRPHLHLLGARRRGEGRPPVEPRHVGRGHHRLCLLYTSDAADERSSVDLGGRRIIKKKNHKTTRAESIDSSK